MKREMRLGRHLTCKRDGQALRSEKRSSQQSAETVAWGKKIVPTKDLPKLCGRGDATRTRNRRFWRPLLYQLSHSPKSIMIIY